MNRKVSPSPSPREPAPTLVEHSEFSCITCGDVAVEAQVVSLERGIAVVERSGSIEEVAVDLVDVVVGDVVLCHAGVALEKLDGAAREIEGEDR